MRFIQQYIRQSQIESWSDWRVPLHQTRQFSYFTLAKVSFPLASVGTGLIMMAHYFPLLISAASPAGLTLLLIAGALLIAAGVYQGLNYATQLTVREGYEEDVEELHQPPQTCWQRFCNL